LIQSRPLGHARLVVVSLVLGLLGWALASWNPLWRFDSAVYDLLLRLSERPAPNDIVIVAIDEASLERHGRWPWPRSLHARLVDQLRRDGARVIGLDIVFSEPDGAGGKQDAHLERSLRTAGNVILPVLIEETRLRGQLLESPPIPPLANAAAGLGHVGAEIDPDGVVRSVYLFEGVGAARWPHFSLAVQTRLDPRQAAAAVHPGRDARGSSPYLIVRRGRVLIPFLGPPGHFTRVSAAQVVAGEFLRGTFTGKTVLLGVTAAGLGDVLPTPVSGYRQPMPGVELNANVLAALRDGSMVRLTPLWVLALTSIVLPATVGVLVVLLSPGWGFALANLALLLVFAISAGLLAGPRIWLPFLSIATPMVLAYPLVSLVRLVSAMRHLGRSLERLRKQLAAMPEWIIRPSAKLAIDDPVAARLYNVETASEQLDRLQRFLREIVEQMADGVLVTDPNGRVVIGNEIAARYLGMSERQQQVGLNLLEIIDRFAHIDPPTARAELARGLPQELLRAELTAGDGRQLLLLVAPLRLGGEQPDGLIVNLADISALRAAERQRSETLAFLSHDLRSPLYSLLAAANNARAHVQLQRVDALADEVERYAHRALHLAESFLWLVRAESVEDMRRVEVNLVNVCEDSIANCLPAAQAKRIEIARAIETDYAGVLGDAELLERAIINLLDNAIKYSPPDSRVRLGLEHIGDTIACWVEDAGPGIAEAERNKLFHRFSRLPQAAAQQQGAGLGLAFVKVVAEKHNGEVLAEGGHPRGSRFTLRLPAAANGHED
jgi:PAS domain S-box-containing protein